MRVFVGLGLGFKVFDIVYFFVILREVGSGNILYVRRRRLGVVGR